MNHSFEFVNYAGGQLARNLEKLRPDLISWRYRPTPAEAQSRIATTPPGDLFLAGEENADAVATRFQRVGWRRFLVRPGRW